MAKSLVSCFLTHGVVIPVIFILSVGECVINSTSKVILAPFLGNWKFV